jgi:hypothetical protein
MAPVGDGAGHTSTAAPWETFFGARQDGYGEGILTSFGLKQSGAHEEYYLVQKWLGETEVRAGDDGVDREILCDDVGGLRVFSGDSNSSYGGNGSWGSSSGR